MKFSKYNLLVAKENDNQHYLFNTFNGSCFDIDNSTMDIIKNNNIEKLDEETKKSFINTGILIQDAIDEDKIFSYMYSREKYDSSSISSTVLLTWACNLRCTYCFQGHDNRSETMTIEQADQYIKFLTTRAKNKGSKHISVVLFGGEPLVNMKVGFHILEKTKSFCEENQMVFNSAVITNGTLLNEVILKQLQQYNCKMIQITLDGIKEVHDNRRIYINGQGSFDDTINALQLLNEKSNINTVIRVNIDKTNIDNTHQLIKYIGKDGINLTKCTLDFGIVRVDTGSCSGYSSNCFTESEIGNILYDLWNFSESHGFKYNIRPMRKTMYCGLYGENQFTVTPNCDVYKCWEHVGQKEHLMGKIDDGGNLTDVTYAFYDWMSVDPLKNDECKKCIYLPTCGGGCGVISYNETGTYHSTGCHKIKGTIEKQVFKYVEAVMKAKNEQHKCNREHI